MLYNHLLLHIPGLNCFWWLLLAMLLPLLLGLLLGYWLWYQYKRQAEKYRAERDDYHARFTNMEKEYAALKYKYDELQKDNQALRDSLHSTEADIAVLRVKLERAQHAGVSAATTPQAMDFGSLFAMDNLQVVEGVGPKIEQVLKGTGIGTWAVLATKTPNELKAILEEAGGIFKLQDPATWPEQATLASQGKWKELVALQKSLDAGRALEGSPTPAKIELMALRLTGGAMLPVPTSNRFEGVFTPSDLQVIEGIGPKIEAVLKNAGLGDLLTVSMASTEQLADILQEADPSYRIHDPASWPGQASLAAAGKWEELVEYQKALDTGKGIESDKPTPAKVETLLLKRLGFAGSDPRDLKIVEGIGPKIEQLLKDAGINNWSTLARTTVDELRDILLEAGDRYRLADPSTWPRQAGLAAAGDWKALKEYQDFLEGGKNPEAEG